MRDHVNVDELVRRLARVDDERLLAECDPDAEDELTRQILAMPREPDIVTRLASRHRRRGWQPALVGLAVVAVTTLVMVVGSPSDSPPAIADWTAEPTPLTADEWDAFDAACRGTDHPHGERSILDEDDQLIIADRRGRITYGLYVAPDGRLSDCHHYEALPGSRSLGGGGTGTSSEPAAPLQRPLDVHDARPRFEASGQAAAEALYGRIDHDVDQVTIHLDDGRSLTASLDDRHYLGWWPITCSGPLIDRGCTPTVSEVEATDNDGRVLDRWVPADSDSRTLIPANPAQPEP